MIPIRADKTGGWVDRNHIGRRADTHGKVGMDAVPKTVIS